MPNTQQSEIHNSLASALFALFNSSFSFSNQWIDAMFLQPSLEIKNILKYLSAALWFVSPAWALWCPQKIVGLDGSAPWQNQTSLLNPGVCLRSVMMLLSEFWHYCSTSTYAFWVVILKPHKSRFPFGTFYDKFPLLSQLLIVPVRKQLLKHRSCTNTRVCWCSWEREKVYLRILENT